MNEIDTLYEICETLSMELEECAEKIRQANGKLSAGDIDYLDKLTHTMKSVKTVLAMAESEDYSGNSMDGSGESGRGSYDNGTSNRGRGRGARRDHMGRYSRTGASEDFRTELEELMNKAPDEKSRMKIERLMKEMK